MWAGQPGGLTLAKDYYKQIVFPHFVPQNILLGGGGSVMVGVGVGVGW